MSIYFFYISFGVSMMNIALYGRSGSGKTTIAQFLVKNYGYNRCSTGDACRHVSKFLFQSESKKILNQVTDAMRIIDQNVWLRTALTLVPDDSLIVFDSMRFFNDYNYLKARSFSLWKVEAPIELRLERLYQRGQLYDLEEDENHITETELEKYTFDYTIDNSDILFQSLYRNLNAIMLEIATKREKKW
jgi:dephospho-CoA kinase